MKKQKLPRSLWRITDIDDDHPFDDLAPAGTLRYRLSFERRGAKDELVVFSKEGAPPPLFGYLERTRLPDRPGLAVIWSNGVFLRESVGGGYTREAIPCEWNAA